MLENHNPQMLLLYQCLNLPWLVSNNETQKILKARLLHQILAVILRADREDDFVLSDTEMEILIIRMTMVNG